MRVPHGFFVLFSSVSAGQNRGIIARNSRKLYGFLTNFRLSGEDKNLRMYSMAKKILHVSSTFVIIGCGDVFMSRSRRVKDLLVDKSYGMRHCGHVPSTKLNIDMAKNTIEIQNKN